jgi:hypothetical protein
MSRALLDLQSAPDGLHDNPTYQITDEELASRLRDQLPWLMGKRSWADWLNEVRALAQKLGIFNKGSPGWRNRYEAQGKAKPEDRPEGGTGAYPTLALSLEWPAPTPAQVAAAGVFPSRQAAGIQLGLNTPTTSPPAMTAERAREIADEVMRNRGHAGAPL